MAFLDAVTARRHHAFGPSRSFRLRARKLAPGFCTPSSPCGHCRCCLCFDPFFTHPPSCPPSLSLALLSGPLAVRRRSGTMRALTPALRSYAKQVSPLTPLCLPNIPPPTTSVARAVALSVTSARPVGPLVEAQAS